MLNIGVEIAMRCLLLALFLPFSALDKILNYRAAVAQAREATSNPWLARMMILAGFAIEVLLSIAILSGILDRLAALMFALYCIATALLWKQFWTIADFRLKGASRGRDTFWDFMKNLALAGGFLLLTFGSNVDGVRAFFAHPFASSHPYETVL